MNTGSTGGDRHKEGLRLEPHRLSAELSILDITELQRAAEAAETNRVPPLNVIITQDFI